MSECRASAVGGKGDGDGMRGEERTYLVKLIANNDLHDFRWHIVLKPL
jgi:hypothetical protein